MSVNIKMNHYDLCVSINLTTLDDYEVNTHGFLSTLEDFLSKLEFYDNVSIEIKREAVPVSQTNEDWPFEEENNTKPEIKISVEPIPVDLNTRPYEFKNSGVL